MKAGSVRESKTLRPKENTVSLMPKAERMETFRSVCWTISSLFKAGIREGI